MVNLDEINAEIAKLESQPTTYAMVEKLALLYTVRDHNTAPVVTGEKMPEGNSDFMQACSGKSICQVMEITDELMEALSIVQPRLYYAVMDKLT